MGQCVTKAVLPLKIFTDEEYEEAVENMDLNDRLKRIILKHGPFTCPEIDVFVEENLNRPVLEEIFNYFKGDEGIRNAMKKYGVTTEDPIMSHLIYLEFFAVNENLLRPGLPRIFPPSMKTLLKETWSNSGQRPNKS